MKSTILNSQISSIQEIHNESPSAATIAAVNSGSSRDQQKRAGIEGEPSEQQSISPPRSIDQRRQDSTGTESHLLPLATHRAGIGNLPLTKPALRYFGGKWRLSPWIIAHFPEHHCYVEPFAGSFSVGLRKPAASREVYNDLHLDMVNFFRVLQRQPQALIDAIANSLVIKAEFQRCLKPNDDPVEWARRSYLYCQLAYIGGGGRWSHGISPSRLSNFSFWDTGHLWAVSTRIQSLEIENQDALSCIQKYDSPRTLFYCDPPYVHSARGSKDKRHQYPVTPRRQYLHEMSDADHRQLAAVLKGIQGRVVLSGYASNLYEDLYQDWTKVEKQTSTIAHSKRVECLWISPEPPKIFHVPLPPEHISEGKTQLQSQLIQLERERDLILNDGPIAEKGTWIETCKVTQRKGWRQAMWKADKPLFRSKRQRGDSQALCKTQYIGKVGSLRHQQAKQAFQRRRRLTKIENQMLLIEQQMEQQTAPTSEREA